MITWKRSVMITSQRTAAHDEAANLQIEAFKERVLRVFEGLAKGALATALYGSGALVLSGVLFYFSWELGIAGWTPPPRRERLSALALNAPGATAAAVASRSAPGSDPQAGTALGRASDGG
jgi:hypothetical protein